MGLSREPTSVPRSLGRDLAVWLLCCLCVAPLLVIYFRMPLLPILLGSGLALAATVLRYQRSRKKLQA